MAKMALSGVPLCRQGCSTLLFAPSANSSFVFSLSPIRKLSFSASMSTDSTQAASVASPDSATLERRSHNRWKPMCLYYAQGKCIRMDDPAHLEIFNHNLSIELQANAAEFQNVQAQPFDFFLVLDLEGKVEILEFLF